jgi:hypothetical protein
MPARPRRLQPWIPMLSGPRMQQFQLISSGLRRQEQRCRWRDLNW